ncbi:MAG: hypothetical protein V4629_03835 [Pseudomonadota bacterium]
MGNACDPVQTNYVQGNPCNPNTNFNQYGQDNAAYTNPCDAQKFDSMMDDPNPEAGAGAGGVTQPGFMTGGQPNVEEGSGTVGGAVGNGASPIIRDISMGQGLNYITADGTNHGFPEGLKSFVERMPGDYQAFKDAGIITSDDPYEGFAQVAAFFKNEVAPLAGDPNELSFNDDVYIAVDKFGLTREQINTLKFMFDAQHYTEGRSDAGLRPGDYSVMGLSGTDIQADAANLRSIRWVNEMAALVS